MMTENEKLEEQETGAYACSDMSNDPTQTEEDKKALADEYLCRNDKGMDEEQAEKLLADGSASEEEKASADEFLALLDSGMNEEEAVKEASESGQENIAPKTDKSA